MIIVTEDLHIFCCFCRLSYMHVAGALLIPPIWLHKPLRCPSHLLFQRFPSISPLLLMPGKVFVPFSPHIRISQSLHFMYTLCPFSTLMPQSVSFIASSFHQNALSPPLPGAVCTHFLLYSPPHCVPLPPTTP